ncbi:MAG: HAD family hydrolase [Terrimicrobiaceae bacterium]
MTSSGRRLLLFDIDGTLLTSGGAGEFALCSAMKERFAIDEDLSGIVLAGATDGAIAREMLLRRAINDTPENMTALLDGYLHALRESLPRHTGRLLPGILPLLEALRSRPDCVMGLLTGNLAKGAELKLRHYGVWDYFEFGAFADDHHDRNHLGPFARSRAAEIHGEEFPPERIYVIGDTPRDIACGKAFGAQTVAIATGNYALEELLRHHPDHAFQDLSDTGAVIRALTA